MGILQVCRQQPVEEMEDEEGENPVVEHGMPLPIVEGFGLGVGTTSNGLTPALPISTEPNGIPVRAAPPGEVGDVAAEDEALLLELGPHVPEVAAPPGNVPVPTPSPPPSKFVLKPDIPPDIPNDGPPTAKHVVPFPVIPIVPAGAPLTPGDASSVAPMGIPVGGTGEPAAMPSGEVAPIPGVGLPIPPTCANAGMQPKSAACIAAINTRRILISIVRTMRPALQQKQRSGRLVSHNIGAVSAVSIADVRPTRAVRRAVPIITISVARPVTAMAVIAVESTSETAAHAGSTKVAPYARTAETATASAGKSTAEATNVAAAAEPAAHMAATTETATVSTPASPAARKRVSGESPGESGRRRQDDHSLA
jgi:hypothetical protein